MAGPASASVPRLAPAPSETIQLLPPNSFLKSEARALWCPCLQTGRAKALRTQASTPEALSPEEKPHTHEGHNTLYCFFRVRLVSVAAGGLGPT